MIVFVCKNPQCGRTLKTDRWRNGQKGKCSYCGEMLVIPAQIFPEPAQTFPEQPTQPFPSNLSVQPCLPVSESLKKQTQEKFPIVFFLLLIGTSIAIAFGVFYWKIKPQLQSPSIFQNPISQNTESISPQLALEKERETWKKNWSAFQQQTLPVFIQKRNFSQAKKEIEQWKKQAEPLFVSSEIAEVERILLQIKDIQELFQLPFLQCQKDKKMISISLENKKLQGKILEILENEIALLVHKKRIVFSLEKLDSKTLLELLPSATKKNKKTMATLAILFHYEGEKDLPEKYKKKSQ